MDTGTGEKLLVGGNDLLEIFFFFFGCVPLMYMCDNRGQVTFFVHETKALKDRDSGEVKK